MSTGNVRVEVALPEQVSSPKFSTVALAAVKIEFLVYIPLLETQLPSVEVKFPNWVPEQSAVA
eukprot:CAMPEP_0181406072 /NCGR_PEP_ID=MMETSP1110-20121109/5084_1 /TAXON_ID=174948 /ORGANISM="Symbiodinium sp., Strain CCMP421" /LENGTH=62 /DNA_ID=CAMNT_0023528475 /DNA_START=448 /DNA_END=636 /DNA_ORIENTATION=+